MPSFQQNYKAGINEKYGPYTGKKLIETVPKKTQTLDLLDKDFP